MSADLAGQLPLFLAWTVYLALHSALAAPSCRQRLVAVLPVLGSHYRLAFNAFALAALVPIVILAGANPGPEIWAWRGIGKAIADGAAVLAILLLPLTTRGYDLKSFLGVAPPAGAAHLVISPAHRFVRHPWYAIGLVVLWTRDMNASLLATALAVSFYLPIGIYLEERKLIAEFGRRYLRYRQRVAPLVPLPWRILSPSEARELLAERSVSERDSS